MRHLPLLLALTLVLAACGGTDAAGGGAEPPPTSAATSAEASIPGLDQTTWVLDTDGEPPLPTLTISGQEISGTDGCNNYGAALLVDDEAIRGVGPVRATRRACESHAYADYLSTLGEVTTATASDDTLVLSGPGGELRFRIG